MNFVILMAYGSPTRMEDVPSYLSGIYEGKPVPEYAMKENMEKYSMVGGVSPSNAIVDKIVNKMQIRLSCEHEFKVVLGNKHWKPWLESVIREIRPGSGDTVIAFPLFPFPSENVKNSYLEPLEAALRAVTSSPKLKFINGLTTEALVRIWSPIVAGSYKDGDAVLFDAHSLPIFRGNEDQYNSAFMAASRAIAEESGIQEYFVGYQSRGKYGSRWLGPSVYDVLERIRDRGYESVLAVPIGFLYEHLEILYDLDLEFGGKVKESGINYHRTGLPDDSDRMVDELVSLVKREVA